MWSLSSGKEQYTSKTPIYHFCPIKMEDLAWSCHSDSIKIFLRNGQDHVDQDDHGDDDDHVDHGDHGAFITLNSKP